MSFPSLTESPVIRKPTESEGYILKNSNDISVSLGKLKGKSGFTLLNLKVRGTYVHCRTLKRLSVLTPIREGCCHPTLRWHRQAQTRKNLSRSQEPKWQRDSNPNLTHSKIHPFHHTHPHQMYQKEETTQRQVLLFYQLPRKSKYQMTPRTHIWILFVQTLWPLATPTPPPKSFN